MHNNNTRTCYAITVIMVSIYNILIKSRFLYQRQEHKLCAANLDKCISRTDEVRNNVD